MDQSNKKSLNIVNRIVKSFSSKRTESNKTQTASVNFIQAVRSNSLESPQSPDQTPSTATTTTPSTDFDHSLAESIDVPSLPSDKMITNNTHSEPNSSNLNITTAMTSPSRIPICVKNGIMPHHRPNHQRSHYSSPVMMSPIPSNCSTPCGSRRPSIGNTPTTPRLSMCAHHPHPHHCHITYVPLCELQRALKKGEVLEGVLRINAKNFEDSYISAPDGGTDIYIPGAQSGHRDRNNGKQHDNNNARNRYLALNGDRVKVRLRPENEWKILYETIRSNWNEWSDEFYHWLAVIHCDECNDNIHNQSNQLIDGNNAIDNDVQMEEQNIQELKSEKIQEPKEQELPKTPSRLQEIQAEQLEELVKKSLKNEEEPTDNEAHKQNRRKRGKHSKSTSNYNNVVKVEEDDVIEEKTGSKSENDLELPQTVQRLQDIQPEQLKEPVKQSPKAENKKPLKQKGNCSQKRSKQSKPLSNKNGEKVEEVTDNSKWRHICNEILSNDVAKLDISSEPKVCTTVIAADIKSPDKSKKKKNNKKQDFIRVVPQSGEVLPEKDPVLTELLDQVEEVKRRKEEKAKKKAEKAKRQAEKKKEKEAKRAAKRADLKAEKKAKKRAEKEKETDEVDGANGVTQKSSEGTKSPKKKKKKSTRSPRSKDPLDMINGLPRALLAMTPLEIMLNFSFGRRCVQPIGDVVEIVEKIHPRIAAGRVTITDSLHLTFQPTDTKVPPILISRDTIPHQLIFKLHLSQNALFMARIDDWPENSPFPIGHLIDHLGEVGEIEAESRAILLENEVDDSPFSEEIERSLVERFANWSIPEDEIKNRRDFRHELVFTIDPMTARDLDDALSIRLLNEEVHDGAKVYEIGVHIADVSFFVDEGSPLDDEAKRRSTSFYLVHRMIPMLSRTLCERMCSLTSGEDKLTFLVVWKMTEDGKVLDTWFGRTIIRSAVKLSYEHVQEMIDQRDLWEPCPGFPVIFDDWSESDLLTSCLRLYDVSRIIRSHRFQNGSLKLDKVKFNFVLNPENGLPEGFSVHHGIDANFVVEEFMLLANRSVAEKLVTKFPEIAFLRNHPSPDENMLNELRNLGKKIGVSIDTSTSGSIHRTMVRVKERDPQLHAILSHMLLRSMKSANYFNAGICSYHHHYALNIDRYTHFTSPIRRYPDLIVHRMLAAALDVEAGGVSTLKMTDPIELQILADHCNARKTASRLTSESSQQLFLCLFLRTISSEEDAIVTNILDRSFDVLVPKFGILRRVGVEDMKRRGIIRKYRYFLKNNSKVMEISWSTSNVSEKQTIEIATRVRVKLIVNEENVRTISAVLLSPETN